MFDTYSAHLDQIKEQHAEMIRAGLVVDGFYNASTPVSVLLDKIKELNARISLLEERLESYKKAAK